MKRTLAAEGHIAVHACICYVCMSVCPLCICGTFITGKYTEYFTTQLKNDMVVLGISSDTLDSEMVVNEEEFGCRFIGKNWITHVTSIVNTAMERLLE